MYDTLLNREETFEFKLVISVKLVHRRVVVIADVVIVVDVHIIYPCVRRPSSLYAIVAGVPHAAHEQ